MSGDFAQQVGMLVVGEDVQRVSGLKYRRDEREFTRAEASDEGGPGARGRLEVSEPAVASPSSDFSSRPAVQGTVATVGMPNRSYTSARLGS
jgi:hypothetical protein